MPDPTRKTVSASQIAALWNKSPYLTRWMLHHWFRGTEKPDKTHSRMSWGKKMEPLIIEAAAEDLRLEVAEDQAYATRGPIGCTRDAIIHDPQRGPGVLESKCVFDYRQWMQRWDGGNRPPEDILLQVYAQMYVGDGTKPFEWGVIATWVCGEMKYFPIEPCEKLHVDMAEAAALFLDQVRDGPEPDPFGLEIEMPILKKLFPAVEEKRLSLPDDYELGEAARMFDWLGQQEKGAKRAKDQIKVRLLDAARYEENGETKMAQLVEAPGALIKIRTTKAGAMWPEVTRLADPGAPPEPSPNEEYRI